MTEKWKSAIVNEDAEIVQGIDSDRESNEVEET
jgi:hypothetical protein